MRRLQAEEALRAFYLAGGTSLALYLGHRLSIDLDLFTPDSFDHEVLATFLKSEYGFEVGWMAKNTLKGEITGVKIDCITHNYPLLAPPYEEDGLRLYSMEDIIAMKLSVISDNGTRMKDFIDIAYLSTRYSLSDMLGFYEKKFDADPIRVLKSITYFNDIDSKEDIVLLKGTFSWKRIEKRLYAMMANQDSLFKDRP